MGCGFEWHCNDCGAGESYQTGVGFASFNNAEDIKDVRKGVYGPLAKLAVEQSDDVVVLSHQAYYRCELCGSLVQGTVLRISQQDDKRAIWATNPPKECSHCHEEMESSDPLLESAMDLYTESISRNGCPKCGSKHVECGMLLWD